MISLLEETLQFEQHREDNKNIYFKKDGIFHMRNVLTDAESLLFISFAALFVIAMAQWKKEWDLNEEKDKRLSIQQMCRESYEQLMIEVRNRQHEFQNHLAAVPREKTAGLDLQNFRKG